jgi:BirA family biotin operon repressor/biotin-[acetyl-CoA-carboxylase] ligase
MPAASVRPTIPYLAFASVPSTNDVARAEGRARLPELGTLGGLPALAVRADAQTAGRGRAGRTWLSPAGSGLYLSIYLRPAWAPRHAAWLTLAAALAVRDACASMRAPGALSAALKWPNDLLAPDGSGRKLGGILVESNTRDGRVDEAVIGIGLNLRPPASGFPPPHDATAAALVEAADDPAPDPDRLATAILAALAIEIAALEADPAAAAKTLVERARRASPLWGRVVAFEHHGRGVRGVARTWAEDGGLEVVLEDGTPIVVHAGDVAVQWGSPT